MSANVKPWLLVAGIFIVGVVTGSALTFGLGPRFMHPPGAHDMKRHWMARLTRDLNLTADQQAKIQPILTDAETKIQMLHREEIGRGALIIRSTDDQISAFLTPDQKVELQKIQSEREKMFSGHLRPWGPPPPGMFPHGGPGDMMPPPPPLPLSPATESATNSGSTNVETPSSP